MSLIQAPLSQSGESVTNQQLLKRIDLELLGERIRHARTDQKISQRDLCKDLFTSAYLSYVELGKTRPTLANLEKLAERLHKPVEFFLRTSGLVTSSKVQGGLEREHLRNLELQNLLIQGQVALSGNDFGQVENILAVVRPHLSRLPSLDQAQFHLLEAGFYNALDVPEAAITSLNNAFPLAEGPVEPEVHNYLQAQLELEKGIALSKQDQSLQALNHFQKGLGIARGLVKTPDKINVYRKLLGEISRSYLNTGDPAKALEYSQQLLDLPEETLNERATSLFKEGLRLSGLGDYHQSSFYLGRSAQIWQDRKEISALQELTLENAQVYLQAKKYPEAKKTARLAYRLHTSYPVDKFSKPGELKALLLLIQVYLGMEDLAEIKTVMELAEQIFQELEEKEPLEEARYYFVSANAYNRLDQLEKAQEYYQRALDILRPISTGQSDPLDRTLLADVYFQFSQLLKKGDNVTKALDYLDKAFRLRSR